MSLQDQYLAAMGIQQWLCFERATPNKASQFIIVTTDLHHVAEHNEENSLCSMLAHPIIASVLGLLSLSSAECVVLDQKSITPGQADSILWDMRTQRGMSSETDKPQRYPALIVTPDLEGIIASASAKRELWHQVVNILNHGTLLRK